MHLEQLYLGCLSQASYLIVDDATKTAAVVDPRRDVGIYLEKAAARGATIRHVLLTHFHADFLAGHLELRAKTGATIHLGARGKAQYLVEPMKDGGSLRFGDVRLDFLETPGHTPESVCIVVYDLARDARKPQAVLTGDTLFIGDVGRPDLMVAAGMKAEDLAGMLYDSLHQKLLKLPDETIVYPGHGAGSACGKSLSSDTSSTLGQQRKLNYALQPMTREEFVALVTAAQPNAPAYFSYDAGLNQAERRTLDEVLTGALKPLELDEVLARVKDGALLLDTREADAFAAEHVRGSLNIGLGGRYASWAGTMLSPEKPIVVLADPGAEEEAALRLGRIGFDRVVGFLRGGIASARTRPEILGRYARYTPETLAEALASPKPPQVVDVRTNGEWDSGHIDGAVHLELDHLAKHLSRVPKDREVVVVCRGGYRSSIGASLLEGAGFARISDLRGGMDAWNQAPSGACAR